jgi:hypothetical protein
MATVIRFSGTDGAGGPMSTYVTESPEEVFKQWTRAGGQPFTLTHTETGKAMYVNPQNVACWFERRE